MPLFDVSPYEIPSLSSTQLKIIRHQVGLFLKAYKVSCELLGLKTFSLTSIESYPLNQISCPTACGTSSYSSDKERYDELNTLYVRGICHITHPFSSDMTIRRRKIFLLKYGIGLSNHAISDRIGYQHNTIIEESKVALIQFAMSLGFLS